LCSRRCPFVGAGCSTLTGRDRAERQQQRRGRIGKYVNVRPLLVFLER